MSNTILNDKTVQKVPLQEVKINDPNQLDNPKLRKKKSHYGKLKKAQSTSNLKDSNEEKKKPKKKYPRRKRQAKENTNPEAVDIDDANISLDWSEDSFDSKDSSVNERRAISDLSIPSPNFVPPRDLLSKKQSVSELIQQHQGQLTPTRILHKPSVSELVQQHGGGIRRIKEIKPDIDSPITTNNPFEVTLRPTKKQNSNGKFTSESLPEIQPTKSIIGLLHQQILSLDITDVKIKTIVSSTKVSKFAQNALNFVIKHTDDLFEHPEMKPVFFKLCIGVALYESIGFRKTLRNHPQITEWFGSYDEINLETTRTKLTPSNKDIHQNNFDYSVLSYFGHILIWALHHQRVGGVSLFTDKYDIELSQSTIKSSIGGYHLWDRLVRESKGMNSKRWKHVIKFRQSFAYEEDQFMLMLRFMKVDSIIP